MSTRRRDRKQMRPRNFVRNFLIIPGFIFLFLLLVGTAAVALTPLPPIDVPAATRVYDAHDRLITLLHSGENRTPVPLDLIPRSLREAIVATEDTRFYKHFGIDPISVARASWTNLKAGRIVEGASTLTQQLAKNRYLTHDRTWSRKIREVILTLRLETQYSKEKILEMYLNEIYFGQGAYGVEAAAQTYFGKSVKDLNLSESAMLAGLPLAPSYYDPRRDLATAQARRNTVLDLMARQGYISWELAEATKKTPLELAPPDRNQRQTAYFVDYILELIEDEQPQLADDLLQGGYRIYTTLDLEMQAAAEQSVRQHLIPGHPDEQNITQPQVALVAVDPINGAIRAMVGGRDYGESSLNRAVGGPERRGRQPGSAFKPFLYTALLARGYTTVDRLICEPEEYPGVNKDPWPVDYGDDPYHWRPVTLREAVEISDNVVSVKWANIIKPQTVIQTAKAMGIDAQLGSDLSLVLGSYEVTPLDLTAAYAPLANMGWYVKPMAIRRVEDRNGRTVWKHEPETHKVLDERVAYLMTDILKGVLTRGTGRHLHSIFDRPAAGKTGTTEDNRDAWFVGYTPELVTGVWVGYDTPRTLPGVGSTLAGPIWAHFMQSALLDVPVTDFPRPEGIISLQVSSLDGLLPNLFSPRETEIFIAGTEPQEVSPLAPWNQWFGDPENPEQGFPPEPNEQGDEIPEAPVPENGGEDIFPELPEEPDALPESQPEQGGDTPQSGRNRSSPLSDWLKRWLDGVQGHGSRSAIRITGIP